MPPVTLSCTPTKLIISGEDPTAVQQRLDELIKEGAVLLSLPAQVGKIWLASCQNPGLEACVTTSSRLGTAHLVVRGRTREIVEEQVRAFELAGVLVTSPPQQDRDEWVAVLNTFNSGLMRVLSV